MIILLFLAVLVAPILTGSLVSAIFREKTLTYAAKYGTGFVSLVGVLLAVQLVSLKLDMGFDRLSVVFLILCALLSLAGIPFLKKPCGFAVKKDMFLVAVLTAITALYAFVYLAPSFVNDDSFEIVANSIATKTIYEYSSMTGQKMIAGLPIFNKIYIMPVLLAVLCSRFGASMWLVGAFLIPTVVFVTGVFLVNDIANELNIHRKSVFLITFLLILVAGTYLPKNGIPVTAGYAILREGYSGYAVAYGILLPLAVLLLLKKKYLYAIVMFLPMLSLVRIDRIFYALLSLGESYGAMNRSGKHLGLFLFSVCAMVIYTAVKRKKINWWILLCPPVFVAFSFERLVSDIADGSRRMLFCLGGALIILSSCYLTPFADAEPASLVRKYEEYVKEEIAKIDDFDHSIYGSAEFMAAARRIDGRVKTLYGRDDVSEALQGLDYEETSEYARDFYHYMLNYNLSVEGYALEHSEEEILKQAEIEGMRYFIPPVE